MKLLCSLLLALADGTSSREVNHDEEVACYTQRKSYVTLDFVVMRRRWRPKKMPLWTKDISGLISVASFESENYQVRCREDRDEACFAALIIIGGMQKQWHHLRRLA